MPTRAELQVELRQLVAGSGYGRIPISAMKRADLEAYVLAARELKQKKDAHKATIEAETKEMATLALTNRSSIPDAKRGPSGPRKIPVEAEALDEDDEVIKVPGQPPAKLLVAPVRPKKESKEPKKAPAPKPKADTKTVTIEEPASGKSSKVAYYPGGCPTCGKH